MSFFRKSEIPPHLAEFFVPAEIGLEASPDMFVAEMVSVFREVRRVLRDDATLWLNLGDSYNAAGRVGHGTRVGYKQSTNRASNSGEDHVRASDGGLKPKDLLMIPARVALALQADGWWLRKDIIWAKPNPMPESATDRPTSSHEHVFLLTKRPTYFFDGEAVREEGESGPSDIKKMTEGLDRIGGKHKTLDDPLARAISATNMGRKRSVGSPGTRNIRDVWTIATSPYSEAHFATFPAALAERCIKAGTSEKGCCSACGAPWERQVERTFVPTQNPDFKKGGRKGLDASNGWGDVPRGGVETTTTGWRPTCKCDAAVAPCVVLDPFAGAFTSLLVADRLQRDGIGIELNPAYAEMARKRLTNDSPLFAEVK